MGNLKLNGIFRSPDSRYMLKTAFLVTFVPFATLLIIAYSLWILLLLNYSFFTSNGFSISNQFRETFFNYILQSQTEYLPYLGIFFILVFFLGLFLAHLGLREFNQVAIICDNLNTSQQKKIKISAMANKKLIIKLSLFIKEYFEAQKNKKEIIFPKEFSEQNGPALDWVFYFQFICLMLILMIITVISINIFTTQLFETIIQTAITTLKSRKGLLAFFGPQQEIIDAIVFTSSFLSCALYALIGKFIISRIEVVTYIYLSEIKKVAAGQVHTRMELRATDPGQHAAIAINKVLDSLHPIK